MLRCDYICNIMLLRNKSEVNGVSEPILRITPKKYTEESAVVSLRLPKDMLRDIDMIAASTGRTRNEILTTSLEFAIRHMEIGNGENE